MVSLVLEVHLDGRFVLGPGPDKIYVCMYIHTIHTYITESMIDVGRHHGAGKAQDRQVVRPSLECHGYSNQTEKEGQILACLLITPVTTFVGKEAPANRGRPHRRSPHIQHAPAAREGTRKTSILCPRYLYLHTYVCTILLLLLICSSLWRLLPPKNSQSFSITCSDHRELLSSPICISSG